MSANVSPINPALSIRIAHRWIHVRVLLSRFPARKKKIYIYSENQEQVKRHRGKMMSKIRALAWSTSRPLIAAYIAKKLAEKVKTRTAQGLFMCGFTDWPEGQHTTIQTES